MCCMKWSLLIAFGICIVLVCGSKDNDCDSSDCNGDCSDCFNEKRPEQPQNQNQNPWHLSHEIFFKVEFSQEVLVYIHNKFILFHLILCLLEKKLTKLKN